MFRPRICKTKIVVAILAMLLFQRAVCSQNEFTRRSEDNVSDGVVGLWANEVTESLVRASRHWKSCRPKWMRVTAASRNPTSDAAEVFRSLHYELDPRGNLSHCKRRGELISELSSLQTSVGRLCQTENAGSNSIISLKCQRTIFLSTISDNRFGRRHASRLALA